MKGKMPLLLIFLLAVLTPITATLLFFFLPPAEKTNHGELITPVAMPIEKWTNKDGSAISPTETNGKWVLWHASDGECNSDCRRRLCRMRQLRLMLPGNYFRLQRGWMITNQHVPPETLKERGDCKETLAANLTSGTVELIDGVLLWRGNIETLPVAARPPEEYLYLTDPAGRLMMRFPPEATIYEIRTDLKRLLKLSKGWRQVN